MTLIWFLVGNLFQIDRPHDSRFQIPDFQICTLQGPKCLKVPDFQIDKAHDSRFQIPDFQTCAPQVSRDSRFPDLHTLSFQIPELRGFTKSTESRFPDSRFMEIWNLEIWRACKSGNVESGNLRPAEGRQPGNPDAGNLLT